LALEGQPLFDVEKIEIHPKQISKLVIAVIDDEVGTADNVSEYLNAIGFKAIAFYDTATAAAAVHHQVFDGYVVDWLIGKETAEGLIQTIRSSSNPHAPIILLTGEISTGKVNETEVARLMRRFDVLCQEKPTRLPIIAVELSKALGLN
jgi:DNA-binding NtrC family response regulator